ncbi:hypothetical protein P3673_24810, partial [Vibrio parahaemolyticus]|uniref:hypothetical protein n=1 Tax=Vibrio parahaemolyticus TaxID=670 RepID=UPI001BAFA247
SLASNNQAKQESIKPSPMAGAFYFQQLLSSHFGSYRPAPQSSPVSPSFLYRINFKQLFVNYPISANS